MRKTLTAVAAVGALLVGIGAASPALAQSSSSLCCARQAATAAR
ncbi:MAG TPA: hypothetical protein VHN16_08245 [Streptosporangiaceae bacterium]|nr:hypothetical protein [Streptosporangiaceae bacterium]